MHDVVMVTSIWMSGTLAIVEATFKIVKAKLLRNPCEAVALRKDSFTDGHIPIVPFCVYTYYF